MTPGKTVNPVALEAAILSLRRSNPSAVEALIEALKAEEEHALGVMLSESTNQVWNCQGVVSTLRGLRNRMEGADQRVAEFDQRSVKTAQHRAMRGINP